VSRVRERQRDTKKVWFRKKRQEIEREREQKIE